MSEIRAVCFDVGEVIIDEAREYGTWADWLGVPRHTFSAVFGAVIATGRHHQETFQVFRPGFDLTEERARRAAAGQAESFGEEDVHPDVRPCLSQLRAMGLRVALAGNQPAVAAQLLRDLDLPVDAVWTSDGWGVEKPALGFFERIVEGLGVPADAVLYVGDRLDNDIRPAQQIGMHTALVRRGPWGRILRDPAAEERCTFVVDDLTTLADLVATANRR